MKFEEYYDRMSMEEVGELNKIWRISGGDCNINKKEYLRRPVMKFFFENAYFRKAITGEIEDIFIGEKPKEYLKYKVLGLDLPYNDAKVYLKDHYILFEDVIPDDFQEIILEYVRLKAYVDLKTIKIINNKPVDVKSTLFLKLILMINFVYKNKLDVQKMFKVVDVENGLINRGYFINYLQTRHLLTNDGRYIDGTKLYKWINNRVKSMIDFYKYIILQLNTKEIFDFFDIIIKLFEDSSVWIRVEEFIEIFYKYEKEVKVGIELGLILLTKYEEEIYIKLSPEALYMITGERPKQWNNREILVTPLKEVFIPYNFDPFVIQIIDCFGEKKIDNKNFIKYRDDYFIIVDINKAHEVECGFKFTEFVRYIEKYCSDIPDIVSNEVFLYK